MPERCIVSTLIDNLIHADGRTDTALNATHLTAIVCEDVTYERFKTLERRKRSIVAMGTRRFLSCVTVLHCLLLVAELRNSSVSGRCYDIFAMVSIVPVALCVY